MGSLTLYIAFNYNIIPSIIPVICSAPAEQIICIYTILLNVLFLLMFPYRICTFIALGIRKNCRLRKSDMLKLGCDHKKSLAKHYHITLKFFGLLDTLLSKSFVFSVLLTFTNMVIGCFHIHISNHDTFEPVLLLEFIVQTFQSCPVNSVCLSKSWFDFSI